MKITKQARETRQTEMVETYNIALSIRRMAEAPGYDHDRWKRAIYHAVCMEDKGTRDERAALRQALNLP